MKFEKFLKQVGTHGTVVEISESEKWLVCEGVGMVIPKGVDNLLGISNSEYAETVEALHDEELYDPLELKKAILLDPSGGAKAIYRLFVSRHGDQIGITNADYGLLEKKDQLGFTSMELEPEKNHDDPIEVKFMLVFDVDGALQGYITGSQIF